MFGKKGKKDPKIEKVFDSSSGEENNEVQNAEDVQNMSDEEKLDLLATDGMLVKRPILVTEKPAIVGFKESEWEGAV